MSVLNAVLLAFALIGAAFGQTRAAMAAPDVPDGAGGPVRAADFGAIGDGTADDSAALQRALDTGRPVLLANGKRYSVERQLRVPSHGGLVGEGSSEIFARARGFTNTDPRGSARYKPDSNVILASGMLGPPFTPARDIRFENFRLRFEWTEGRNIDGIAARNVEGLIVRGLEISGFPAGVAIKVATISGDSSITGNRIHDSYSDTDYERLYPGMPAQITAIEVDNDRVGQRGSRALRITGNEIADIRVGPAFLASQGDQTDGINVVSYTSEGLVIEDNRIRNVGEGIDHFGTGASIRRNQVDQAYVFGIKLIHGASFNVVEQNTVLRAGLAGIVLWGSSAAPQGIESNVVSDNVISDIDPDGAWDKHETACILLNDRYGDGKVINNVITRNRLNPGERGKWVINRAASTGAGNQIHDNRIDRAGTRGDIASATR